MAVDFDFRRYRVNIVILCFAYVCQVPAIAVKEDWSNSPLPSDAQKRLSAAGRMLKSGKYDRARPAVLAVLETANDVPKCISIAQYTEPYAFPMMEIRRQCMNKALGLAESDDDLILVALKARQYQFFEITRQAITSMIQKAKTVPELYDLARKAQEVALHDVAQMAMEKAYDGINNEDEAYIYANQCKLLGLEQLLRVVLKDLVDDESTCSGLSELSLKIAPYKMRDLNRYALRKALDKCTTVPDMEMIQEAATRLNEPDVAARAQYFVKKGKLIQRMKEDQAKYQAELKTWKEAQEAEFQRQRSAEAATSSQSSSAEPTVFSSVGKKFKPSNSSPNSSGPGF